MKKFRRTAGHTCLLKIKTTCIKLLLCPELCIAHWGYMENKRDADPDLMKLAVIGPGEDGHYLLKRQGWARV